MFAAFFLPRIHTSIWGTSPSLLGSWDFCGGHRSKFITTPGQQRTPDPPAKMSGPEITMSTKLGQSESFQGKGTSFQVLELEGCELGSVPGHSLCHRKIRPTQTETGWRERLTSDEICLCGWIQVGLRLAPSKNVYLCESMNNIVLWLWLVLLSS